jgi:hypothetical protein
MHHMPATCAIVGKSVVLSRRIEHAGGNSASRGTAISLQFGNSMIAWAGQAVIAEIRIWKRSIAQAEGVRKIKIFLLAYVSISRSPRLLIRRQSRRSIYDFCLEKGINYGAYDEKNAVNTIHCRFDRCHVLTSGSCGRYRKQCCEVCTGQSRREKRNREKV